MKSIRLNINDKVYDKIIWFLSKFSSDEIEILDNNSYISEKEYLTKQLNILDSKKATFNTIEELEKILEKRISKHED
jgi:hypothetical protein